MLLLVSLSIVLLCIALFFTLRWLFGYRTPAQLQRELSRNFVREWRKRLSIY